MAHPLTFELFGTGGVPPDDLWAVVADPGRLPDWTDADHVEPGAALVEGSEVVVTVDGRRQAWTVLTADERIWEASTSLDAGELGFGVRVAGDPQGSRLILACRLQPSGSRLRARVVTLPRLRARCDRWIAAALSRARRPG